MLTTRSDIKLKNILLLEVCRAWKDNVIKLIDFGLSNYSRGERQSTFCGTPAYAAPEMILADSYTGAVDVWSVGVALYVMLHGSFPFAGVSDIIAMKVRAGPRGSSPFPVRSPSPAPVPTAQGPASGRAFFAPLCGGRQPHLHR